MSRNRGSQSSTPGKGGLLIVGILVGMLLGLAVAGGVAWYMQKRPSPYQAKGQAVADEPEPKVEAPKPEVRPVEPPKQVAQKPAVHAASSVPDTKPRFEFYKVLTDKPEATPHKPANQSQATVQNVKPTVPDSKPTQTPVKNETYFLQAGSFSNPDDADKLKAKLALLGMEARVLTVTLPEKGVWHRVRLGPYPNALEMSQARESLKQNGVASTPMHAQ